jgi:hypothetical protein
LYFGEKMRRSSIAAHGGDHPAAGIAPAVRPGAQESLEAVMRNHALAALLSFTGGFVDTAGFLGL